MHTLCPAPTTPYPPAEPAQLANGLVTHALRAQLRGLALGSGELAYRRLPVRPGQGTCCDQAGTRRVQRSADVLGIGGGPPGQLCCSGRVAVVERDESLRAAGCGTGARKPHLLCQGRGPCGMRLGGFDVPERQVGLHERWSPAAHPSRVDLIASEQLTPTLVVPVSDEHGAEDSLADGHEGRVV